MKKNDFPLTMAPNCPRRGATMVEAALTITVLMLLVLGIVQFSLVYFVAGSLNNATRDAARYGSVITLQPRTGQSTPRTEAEAKQDITARLKASASGLDMQRLDVTVAYLDDGGAPVAPAPNVKVRVSATYRVPNLAPLIPWLTRDLHAVSTMRVEAQQ